MSAKQRARDTLESVTSHLTEIRAHAPQTLASYVSLARATLARVLTDGRLLPIRAQRIVRALDHAAEAADAAAEPTRHQETPR